MKGKIYLYCQPARGWEPDFVGFAVAEDGHLLASHISSTPEFSKHDLGLTSEWQHGHYRKHYPDGYELEWVEDRKTHQGLQEALRLNNVVASGGAEWLIKA